MEKDPLKVALSYYQAIHEHSAEGVERCLHPDVVFKGPLDAREGKVGVLQAAIGFMSIVNKLEICEKYGDSNGAVIIYDVESPEPIGTNRAASLMKVKDGLITSIELFYDASRFTSVKDQVFAKSSNP